MAALGDDHRKMQEMFFGIPLAFNAMIVELRRWKSEFNRKS
jgi:hypothetical protein